MTDQTPCPHCPDGHQAPTQGQPWGAYLGPERDGDGQPTTIHVMRAAGAHVSEADAEWVWDALTRASTAPAGVRDTARTATRQTTVVAYRNPDRPGVLLCREHGDGWAGLTPLTSDDLPDGGMCTWGAPDEPECGRDLLITAVGPTTAEQQPTCPGCKHAWADHGEDVCGAPIQDQGYAYSCGCTEAEADYPAAAVQPAEAHPARDRWRTELLDVDGWMPCGLADEDRKTAAAKHARRQERRPDLTLRFVRETTTWTTEETS